MAKEQNVTRIRATDKSEPKKAVAPKKKRVASSSSQKTRLPKGLKSFLGYFKGAWEELRQVRWPTRRATWGLTLAVILFSLFFVVLIVLLDLLFKFLFEQIII